MGPGVPPLETHVSAEERAWSPGPGLLESVWRYRVLVLAVAVLASLLTYYASASRAPEYEAGARLFLTDPRNAGVFGDENRVFAEAERYVPQQAERVTSQAVLTRASELLDGRLTVQQLRTAVVASAETEFDVIAVTASDGSAEGAGEIADAAAAAYRQVAEEATLADAETAIDELQQVRAGLEARIEELEAQLPPPSVLSNRDPVLDNRLDAVTEQLLDLEARAQSIQVDASVFGDGVDQVEGANLPESPVSPTPARDAVLAAVLAGALAAAFAYWRSARAQRTESGNDAARILRAPLLAEVQEYRTTKSSWLAGREPADPAAVESYQFVLQSLEYALEQVGGSSVLITSASPGDGKTATALQLSMAAARAGRDTLLVDADLRAHGLSRLLRTDDSVGLTDLAAMDQPLDGSVQSIPVSDTLRLPVVAAGRPVTDPSEFFRSAGFRQALKGLQQHSDLLLIDSPPVLAVAETSIVAGQIDGILLVVNRGTPLALLEQVRDRLAFTTSPLLGFVYNRSDAGATAGYGYGYGTVDPRADRWRRLFSRARPAPSRPRQSPEPVDSTQDEDVIQMGRSAR